MVLAFLNCNCELYGFVSLASWKLWYVLPEQQQLFFLCILLPYLHYHLKTQEDAMGFWHFLQNTGIQLETFPLALIVIVSHENAVEPFKTFVMVIDRMWDEEWFWHANALLLLMPSLLATCPEPYLHTTQMEKSNWKLKKSKMRSLSLSLSLSLFSSPFLFLSLLISLFRSFPIWLKSNSIASVFLRSFKKHSQRHKHACRR